MTRAPEQIGCGQCEVIHADELPPRRPFSSFWDFVVRAYRPVGAWVGVATMIVHGVVIPLLPVFGTAPVAIDWLGVTAFLGICWGPPVVARTVEKLRGVTS